MENQTSLVQIGPPLQRTSPPPKTRADKYPLDSDDNLRQSPYNFSKTLTHSDIDSTIKKAAVTINTKAIAMTKGLPAVYMAALVGQRLKNEKKVIAFASRLQYHKNELKDINDTEKMKKARRDKKLPPDLRRFMVYCYENFHKYYNLHYKYFYSNYKNMQEGYFMPKLSNVVKNNYNNINTNEVR